MKTGVNLCPRHNIKQWSFSPHKVVVSPQCLSWWHCNYVRIYSWSTGGDIPLPAGGLPVNLAPLPEDPPTKPTEATAIIYMQPQVDVSMCKGRAKLNGVIKTRFIISLTILYGINNAEVPFTSSWMNHYSNMNREQSQFISMTSISNYTCSKQFITGQKIWVTASPSTHAL